MTYEQMAQTLPHQTAFVPVEYYEAFVELPVEHDEFYPCPWCDDDRAPACTQLELWFVYGLDTSTSNYVGIGRLDEHDPTFLEEIKGRARAYCLRT